MDALFVCIFGYFCILSSYANRGIDKEVFAYVGEEALLVCQVSDQTVTVTWSKPTAGTIISVGAYVFTDDMRFTVTGNGNTLDLVIQDVTQDDTGVYLCQINHGSNIAEYAVMLNVTQNPIAATTQQPNIEFVVTPKVQTVAIGQRAEFKCKPLEKNFAHMHWYKVKPNKIPDALYPGLEYYGNIEVTEDGTLVIDPVLFEDDGFYKCISGDGKSKAHARLQVQDDDDQDYLTKFIKETNSLLKQTRDKLQEL